MATVEKSAPAKTPRPQLRVVPVDAIQIRENFNPRSTRIPEAWDRTAASIATNGVLAPILVTPTAPKADTYWLVAGEGRLLAARKAGHQEVPVLIRDVDERTLGLEYALAENMAREDLDAVAVARGMAGLRDAGWQPQQIAEELAVTRKLVTERLRILKLPENLHPQIASGEIPLSAIRPLERLAKIHPDLPAVLVARLCDGAPSQSWMEPVDWPTAVDDPIKVLTLDYHGPGCDLPAGIYNAGAGVRPTDLPISDQTRSELRELSNLRNVDYEQGTVRIPPEGIEQAQALKAAFASNNSTAWLIVGEDVMTQVIADQTRAAITRLRERHTESSGPETAGGAAEPTAAASPEEVVEQNRQEREQREEQQRTARAHNDELGAAVVRSLSRVKLDLDLLRVLLAVQPLRDLPQLATRGARYCLPGWPVHETTKTGKRKTSYLAPHEAAQKAIEYLQGASTVGETCGRLFTLIALARYADQRATAASNWTYYGLNSRATLPWDDTTIETIDAICAERLPDHLTRPVREREEAEREAERREKRERDAARERVEAQRDCLPQLTSEQRTALLADVEFAYGTTSSEAFKLRREVRELHQTDTSTAGGTTEPAAA